ncbi:cytochrome c oxidase subunit 2A [Kyrpidia tusciae]|uniref:Cytochrome c oxidase subunit IIa n=1 Tax=Kyrpidia tusciae (strain DSM 2912 / NBRC 15312 / T2) TaxID=562970 RepID=D5WT88_KYRT2|nr:cytochrome c oxidase subunit IIa [Kyrpidia tusciae DSM 2912]MBE3553261.1 cytochrome c oxidase subunit 2A [Kyrpidia tusciae]
MAQMSAPKTRERETEAEENLKGTLASVFIVGAVLLASWLGVFILFLDRN